MEVREGGFTKCYVAFLDILGFSEYVCNLEKEEKDNGFVKLKELFSELKYLSDKVIKYSEKYSQEISEHLKCLIMSDSIAILLPTHLECSLEFLADFCNEIFIFLLVRYNLFTRGAISSGSINFNDTIILGKALVDAVRLEKKKRYPLALSCHLKQSMNMPNVWI